MARRRKTRRSVMLTRSRRRFARWARIAVAVPLGLFAIAWAARRARRATAH